MTEETNADRSADAEPPGDGGAEPSDAHAAAESSDAHAAADDDELGPLLHYEEGEALEARDREHAGPGGEPECPRCGTTMVRSVERHPAPRSDDSPFRVRLVCSAPTCRSWTAYDW